MIDFHIIAVDQLSSRIRLWEVREIDTGRLLGCIKLMPGQQRFNVESDYGDFLADSFYDAKDELILRINSTRLN